MKDVVPTRAIGESLHRVVVELLEELTFAACGVLVVIISV